MSKRVINAGLLTLACALRIGAVDPSKPLATFQRQNWQTESGLPQNTVHAILQTHDGYLWAGTEGGLVRFDGMKFTIYDAQNTGALRSNNIRTLLEDRGHALWVGTADGLTVFNNGSPRLFTRESGLPGNNIWSLYQDRAGRVWVLTADGLAEYRSGRFESRTPDKAASFTGAIAEDTLGNLLLGSQSGLWSYRAGKFSREARDLPAGSVDALLMDTHERLWIGTRQGLFVRQEGALRRIALNGRILSLTETLDGAILAGYDGGIARIADTLDIHSQPGDGVLAVYEDREGDLWTGSETGGLTVFRAAKFVTYGEKEGLADDLIRCIFQDRRSAMWFGTNGGLTKLENGRFTSLTTATGLSSNVIFSLDENRQGDLLVGTQDGLNVIRGAAVQLLTTADGLPDDLVRSLHTDSDGSVWIGTRRGLTLWRDGKFKTYTQADGLGDDFVGTLLRDRAGSLWVGTLRGLTALKDGTFKTYTTKDGLKSNIVTALYADSDNVLWIGTADGGLHRMSDGRIQPVAESPASIFAIVEAGDWLWVTSKTGVYRLPKRPGRAVAQFGTADGLRVSECAEGGHPAAWRDQHGALWFATLRGVSQITPQAMEAGVPPSIVIESILLDDRALDMRRHADIAPGYSRLSFEYAGISLASPHGVHFRYRLDGFDKDWVDAGTRRVAFYTSLPPGQYTFRVAARTNDGDWGEHEAAYNLRLLPHFYQTYWFYLLLLASLALLTYGIYRWRVREVESRFNAVLAERSRIAREIHDTLAQGYVAISLQLELLARKLDGAEPVVKDLVKQAREMVQSSLTEARRSIWELRSQGSDSNDLRARLSKIVSETGAKTGLKAQFHVIGAFRALPENVENELVKISQEALANVVRHAAAKQVNVDLAYQPNGIRMTIVDDGRGFVCQADAVSPPGHYGLSGMRERAQQIGATLNVKSSVGAGTCIEVEKIMS